MRNKRYFAKDSARREFIEKKYIKAFTKIIDDLAVEPPSPTQLETDSKPLFFKLIKYEKAKHPVIIDQEQYSKLKSKLGKSQFKILANPMIRIIEMIMDYQVYFLHKSGSRNNPGDPCMQMFEIIKVKCVEISNKGGDSNLNDLLKPDSDLNQLINFIEELDFCQEFSQTIFSGVESKRSTLSYVRLGLEELRDNLDKYCKKTSAYQDFQVLSDTSHAMLNHAIAILHTVLRGDKVGYKRQRELLRNPRYEHDRLLMGQSIGTELQALLNTPAFLFLDDSGTIPKNMHKTFFPLVDKQGFLESNIQNKIASLIKKKPKYSGIEKLLLNRNYNQDRESMILQFYVLHGRIEEFARSIAAFQLILTLTKFGGNAFVYGKLKDFTANIVLNAQTNLNALMQDFKLFFGNLDSIRNKILSDGKNKDIALWDQNLYSARKEMRHFSHMLSDFTEKFGKIFGEARRGISESEINEVSEVYHVLLSLGEVQHVRFLKIYGPQHLHVFSSIENVTQHSSSVPTIEEIEDDLEVDVEVVSSQKRKLAYHPDALTSHLGKKSKISSEIYEEQINEDNQFDN